MGSSCGVSFIYYYWILGSVFMCDEMNWYKWWFLVIWNCDLFLIDNINFMCWMFWIVNCIGIGF